LLSVLTVAIESTTSIPEVTFPNTEYLLSRKLFKAKAIDNKQYQRELLKISVIQKVSQNAEYKAMEKLNQFVQQKFGVFMHVDAQDLLMRVLES